MIKSKKRGDLIVISGPSGVGKDTVTNRILNENLVLSVSATSRSLRGNEKEGVDYYFLTKEQFEEKINNDEFMEYAQVHGDNYYGTLKSEVNGKLDEGKDVVLVIDIAGALSIKEKMKDVIFIFLLPPSIRELKNRLISRNTENKEQLLKRFSTMYNEINKINEYNYVVVNDNLDDAVNKIKSILLSEKCRVDRIVDLEIDTTEEKVHEDIIEYFDNM